MVLIQFFCSVLLFVSSGVVGQDQGINSETVHCIKVTQTMTNHIHFSQR